MNWRRRERESPLEAWEWKKISFGSGRDLKKDAICLSVCLASLIVHLYVFKSSFPNSFHTTFLWPRGKRRNAFIFLTSPSNIWWETPKESFFFFLNGQWWAFDGYLMVIHFVSLAFFHELLCGHMDCQVSTWLQISPVSVNFSFVFSNQHLSYLFQRGTSTSSFFIASVYPMSFGRSVGQ